MKQEPHHIPTEGERQLERIIEELREFRFGARVNVQCPYCHRHNRPGNIHAPEDWPRPGVSPFCCELFQQAAIAIAEREALRIQIEHKNRIDDSLHAGTMLTKQ